MAETAQSSITKQKQCTINLKDDQESSQQINPLFVNEILENVLSYLKQNNKSTSLSEYRLVCKFWEQEIIKIIRRDTHIKIRRILTPYPKGFGWTTLKGANTYHYLLPYTQIHPFQNVELVLPNRRLSLKNNKYQPPDQEFENWFKLMGHQVKSLIFTCSLKSSEMKYYWFLERILKEWCPNLERLTLQDIRLMEGLVFTSFFQHSTKPIICKNLNEITIAFSWNEDFLWLNPNQLPNIVADPSSLNHFIYNHGLSDSNEDFPEISNADAVKINVPKELYFNGNIPNLSTLLPKNFYPEYLDGGILGQLMNYTKVKRLRLEGSLKPINRKHLVAFFHYRENTWKTCLNHLEIDWRSMENLSNELVVLGRVKFPVVILKLTVTMLPNLEVSKHDMTRFLSYFSETLQHLQFDVIEDEEQSVNLILPVLPKLKIFVLDRINVYQISAFNLATSAPNLEKCHLKGYRYCTKPRGLIDKFFEANSSNISNKQLQDFRLIGENVCFSGAQASNIFEWFPNVKRMELIGMMDDNRGMTDLLNQLPQSKVTDQ